MVGWRICFSASKQINSPKERKQSNRPSNSIINERLNEVKPNEGVNETGEKEVGF